MRRKEATGRVAPKASPGGGSRAPLLAVQEMARHKAAKGGLSVIGWRDERFGKHPNEYVVDMLRTKAKHGDRGDHRELCRHWAQRIEVRVTEFDGTDEVVLQEAAA